MLAYRDDIHEYRFNGAVIPHVTGVLKGLVDYSHIAPDVLANAQEEGKRQHKLVELECKQGPLDPNDIHEFWRPHLFAFRTMVAETGFKLLNSERQVYHPIYGYAGTLDLAGPIFDDEAIIDLKRSLYGGPVIGLQLAAYENALRAEQKVRKPRRRYALRLKPGSTPPYQLKEYADENDFGVFLSLLKVQRWKEQYNRE